jgi:hypothetical protein
MDAVAYLGDIGATQIRPHWNNATSPASRRLWDLPFGGRILIDGEIYAMSEATQNLVQPTRPDMKW